jgi:hypothetical protein
VKLLAAILLLAAAATFALLPPPAEMLPARADGPPPVRGVLHVHTNRSDGTGTPDMIAEAAARAGLAFVVFTDHGDAALDPSAPVYRHGVLCIDAVEISTDEGHVLALGLPRMPFPVGGAARDVLDDIARAGALSIVAHPTSARDSLRWTGGDAGFDGLEWLNGDSEWRDESAFSLARTFWTYWFRPAESLTALLDRPEEALALWDRLSAERTVIGVAGADAHARLGLRAVGEPYDGRPVARLPGYESIFRSFSIALPGLRLTGSAAADAAATLAAIRSGRLLSVLDSLAGPAWLEFSATAAGTQVEQGAMLAASEPVTVRARAPALPGARLRLIRDGREIESLDAAQELTLEQPPEPATFRVEVSLPSAPGSPQVPWLVSNPIYVGRSKPPPWSEPPPPAWPRQRLPLYTDGAASDWTIEHSVRADGRALVVGAVGGTQMNFRFALGGSRTDNPFVALTRLLPGPATAYDRLMFEARSSRPMRISAQLRGADGTRWVRSVYLDETLRRLSLPFRDFRPAGHNRVFAAGDPASVLFVVDGVNTSLGQNGQVWFDSILLGSGDGPPGAAPAQVRTESRR